MRFVIINLLLAPQLEAYHHAELKLDSASNIFEFFSVAL